MITQTLDDLILDFVQSFKVGVPAIVLVQWISQRVPANLGPTIFFSIDNLVKEGKLKKLMCFDTRITNTIIVYLTALDLTNLASANDV